MERYGYDEETAKKLVAEADAENRNNEPLIFGGEE
jgi:hypothetical protein